MQPFLLFWAWHWSTLQHLFPLRTSSCAVQSSSMQDFRANERGQPPPSRARLGEEAWTARENRQKHTYKAADLQINGAQSRAALQVLKECTAMGGGDQLLCGSLLACLWPQSFLSVRSPGPPARIRQRWKETLCAPLSSPLRPKEV